MATDVAVQLNRQQEHIKHLQTRCWTFLHIFDVSLCFDLIMLPDGASIQVFVCLLSTWSTSSKFIVLLTGICIATSK